MADENERARRMGGFALVALASAGVTYVASSHEASAHVLEIETNAATRIAECEEHGATTRIELEGRLAEHELERVHTRCATVGDNIGDATITALRGRSDVRVAQVCVVELDWNSDPMEGCRGFVQCGDVRLYGDLGAGYFACTVDDLGLVHGEDGTPTTIAHEGDPRLVVDRASAELTVSDDAPAWSVTLSIPGLRAAALERETP